MIRNFSMKNRLSSILLLLASICMPSMAQTVDTAIIGTVTDSSGAVVGGATVTATATATGVAKSAVTSANGSFSITYLIPGTYDLKVSANGFNVEEEKGIVLQINQQAKMNVSLHVGGVSQVVEVAATPPLLQTEDASLGVVVGTESAANLPLDGRSLRSCHSHAGRHLLRSRRSHLQRGRLEHQLVWQPGDLGSDQH